MTTKKITRELPVQLTESQIKVRSTELAHLGVEIDAKADAHRVASKGRAKELRDLRKRQSELSKAINDGKELAEIQCEERSIFAQNKIEVIRCDTKEVVETRAMTAADRQMDMNEPAEGSKRRLGKNKDKTDAEKASPPEPEVH
jgi:hypothetical protein